MIAKYLKSSIGRKQVVAVTGLMLIGFVIVHLLGNLTLYAGPEAFNGYVKKLESLGPLLVVARVILASIFLVHISLTAILVVENRKARKQKYAATLEKGKRSISTRLMPVSGTILLLFLITHLLDFSLNNHVGPDSFIGGESLGLYGLVYNYFQNPVIHRR
jgi:succinate dehydrogenase / fumarate reductase cytochrome b subunit